MNSHKPMQEKTNTEKNIPPNESREIHLPPDDFSLLRHVHKIYKDSNMTSRLKLQSVNQI